MPSVVCRASMMVTMCQHAAPPSICMAADPAVALGLPSLAARKTKMPRTKAKRPINETTSKIALMTTALMSTSEEPPSAGE